MHTVSSKLFDTQAPSIFTEELVLPRHARCVLSDLRCNGHSILLSTYLSRIGRIENPLCSACGHLSQHASHHILHCPVTDSLGRLFSGDSLSLYDLWSRLGKVAWYFELYGLPPCPIPRKGLGDNSNSNNRLTTSCSQLKLPIISLHFTRSFHHFHGNINVKLGKMGKQSDYCVIS